jgi:hypothetical protein
MTTVSLIGGPRGGSTEPVPDPWPRSYVIVDDGTGGDVSYLVREGTTLADYADPVALDDASPAEAAGPQGPPGDPGPEGPPGNDGATGPPGPQGERATPFTARGAWNSSTAYNPGDSVTYGGASYYATIPSLNDLPPTATYGTPPMPVWEPLSPGPPGPAGATGAAGAAGPAGAVGATGPAGATGATGPAGAAGATGATGPAGAAGPPGAVEVYEQPGPPATTTLGAIWIDTDA